MTLEKILKIGIPIAVTVGTAIYLTKEYIARKDEKYFEDFMYRIRGTGGI